MQKINMLEGNRKKSRIRSDQVCVWRWVMKLNREVTIGVVEMATFERQGVSLTANSTARVTGAE